MRGLPSDFGKALGSYARPRKTTLFWSREDLSACFGNLAVGAVPTAFSLTFPASIHLLCLCLGWDRDDISRHFTHEASCAHENDNPPQQQDQHVQREPSDTRPL